MHNKIVTRERLSNILKRRGKKRVVFTNGCFDILHRGHVEYLQKAKALGDILIVGLNSDSSVRRIKGKYRPVTREEDRAAVLAALGCVDYVTLFREPTPERLIKALKPDILTKGGDWALKDIVGAQGVLKNGGKVRTITYLKNRSTTALIKKIVRCCSNPR